MADKFKPQPNTASSSGIVATRLMALGNGDYAEAVGTVGTNYEAVAASTTTTLGSSGATGDLLNGVLITPASTSPGAIQIQDGANPAITIFAGGATSVSNLVPFFVYVGAQSVAGAWKVITGANVSVLAVGSFT